MTRQAHIETVATATQLLGAGETILCAIADEQVAHGTTAPRNGGISS